MQFLRKSSNRFKQLKIAQNYIKTKNVLKKEHLRTFLNKEILLANIPWSDEEFKLLVKILHNFDNSVPKQTLLQMGSTNPHSLVKLLYHDIIRKTEISDPNYDPHILTIDEKLQGRTKTPFGLRVGLIGDFNVGKRFISNKFLGKEIASMQFSTLFYQLRKGHQNKQFTFQFRRLAPLDTFIDIRRRFYRNAMTGLVIFDISNPVSFLNAIKWVEETWENNTRKVMSIALVGNKCDLRSVYDVNHIPVGKETIKHYCNELEQKIGFQIPYIEISAKENKNKDELLSYLVKVFEYQELLHSFSNIQRSQSYFEEFVFEKFKKVYSESLNLENLSLFLRRNMSELQSEYNV